MKTSCMVLENQLSAKIGGSMHSVYRFTKIGEALVEKHLGSKSCENYTPALFSASLERRNEVVCSMNNEN